MSPPHLHITGDELLDEAFGDLFTAVCFLLVAAAGYSRVRKKKRGIIVPFWPLGALVARPASGATHILTP